MSDMTNLYVEDGACHNAEPNTYGHECGKSAIWVGTTKGGFHMGFCHDCKKHGSEARTVTCWQPHPRMWGEEMPE